EEDEEEDEEEERKREADDGEDQEGFPNEAKSSRKAGGGTKKTWNELTEKQKHTELVKTVKDFSLKAYKKTKLQKEVDQEAIVCQRENPFYVDTVRAFRDRRYIFKRRLKAAERLREKLEKEGGSFQAKKDADDMVLLNDSLQLAHKCILNSFYGYVKREAARWYSMQMGAVVTKAGSDIIQRAKEMIDGLGVTMELDTDGIWCMLPKDFPQKYSFHLKPPPPTSSSSSLPAMKGKEYRFEYPTTILNRDVHKRCTNDQYLEYEPATRTFKRETRNEVYFELDGPWKAMFLPASEKSDDLLKKRYVIYGMDGSISELKGFELKRRGELQFIKLFQTEVFPRFIDGKSKQEAYASAASVALRYRELLRSEGISVQDENALEELIVTRKVLSKPVKNQGLGKSMSITTGKRLAEFLQNDTYLTDAPVSTQYIVVNRPFGAPKTARAIPVQILHADLSTKAFFYQKWLGLSTNVTLHSSSSPLKAIQEDDRKEEEEEKEEHHQERRERLSSASATSTTLGNSSSSVGSEKDLVRKIERKEEEVEEDGGNSAAAPGGLVDVREIIDWIYYIERLDVQLQKIICIPAMKQGLANPIPEIAVPEWLKKQRAAHSPLQSKIDSFFAKKKKNKRPLSNSSSSQQQNGQEEEEEERKKKMRKGEDEVRSDNEADVQEGEGGGERKKEEESCREYEGGDDKERSKLEEEEEEKKKKDSSLFGDENRDEEDEGDVI
ncbi:dna polymerase family b protein, partial [Cystoisospora suis]